MKEIHTTQEDSIIVFSSFSLSLLTLWAILQLAFHHHLQPIKTLLVTALSEPQQVCLTAFICEKIVFVPIAARSQVVRNPSKHCSG